MLTWVCGPAAVRAPQFYKHECRRSYLLHATDIFLGISERFSKRIHSWEIWVSHISVSSKDSCILECDKTSLAAKLPTFRRHRASSKRRKIFAQQHSITFKKTRIFEDSLFFGTQQINLWLNSCVNSYKRSNTYGISSILYSSGTSFFLPCTVI
jgi:hypothetical protein